MDALLSDFICSCSLLLSSHPSVRLYSLTCSFEFLRIRKNGGSSLEIQSERLKIIRWSKRIPYVCMWFFIWRKWAKYNAIISPDSYAITRRSPTTTGVSETLRNCVSDCVLKNTYHTASCNYFISVSSQTSGHNSVSPLDYDPRDERPGSTLLRHRHIRFRRCLH